MEAGILPTSLEAGVICMEAGLYTTSLSVGGSFQEIDEATPIEVKYIQ